MAQLAGVNNKDMAIFCQQRSQAKEQEVQQRLATLPEVTASTFDGKKYNEFITQFNKVVSCTYGSYGASIKYLLREQNGFYLSPWLT